MTGEGLDRRSELSLLLAQALHGAKRQTLGPRAMQPRKSQSRLQPFLQPRSDEGDVDRGLGRNEVEYTFACGRRARILARVSS